MSRKRCDHEANAMIPWYVNGSLEGDEEAAVRRHLDGCEICTAETEVLFRIAREIGQQVDASFAPPSGRGAVAAPRVAWLIAALLLVPAGLGIWWATLGFPGISREGVAAEVRLPRLRRDAEMRSSVVLNLPALTRAEGSIPTLVVREGAELATITFTPPLSPEADFTIALRGPDGRILVHRDGKLIFDAMGRSTYAVPATVLEAAGDYSLVVTERPASGSERRYEYPFRILPSNAAGP
ncbi:MAG TPA: zf-HC2 domain-containing protein [Verrucomicrobiae bacterium]|nr:zf-HC2 domain-containing protein [Verrucomicrobiae bacterium]